MLSVTKTQVKGPRRNSRTQRADRSSSKPGYCAIYAGSVVLTCCISRKITGMQYEIPGTVGAVPEIDIPTRSLR